METWKLCSLIMKIVILTAGYSGIFVNTESTHAIYHEILKHDLSIEEYLVMDSYLADPESIKIMLRNGEEKINGEAFDEAEEEALSGVGKEPHAGAESGQDSCMDTEMVQEPIETDKVRQSAFEDEGHLQETIEQDENHESADLDEYHQKSAEADVTFLSHSEPTGDSQKSFEETESMQDPGQDFADEVMAIIEKSIKKYPLENPYGLYIKELETGNEFGINEDLTCYDENDGNTDGYFRAASVVKLQIAYAAYRLVEKGDLDPETVWVDPVTEQKLSLLPTLHKMVSRSDNDLFNSMLRLIGREKVNNTLEQYGIIDSNVYGEINPSIGYSLKNNLERHGTSKAGGKITPRDIGIILEAVYHESKTNKYMGMLNEALLANIYNSRIPRGINNKYPVAHKTGTSDDFGVYNDAGIIYGKIPYILVILTKGESSSKAQGFIRMLSKEITDYMDNLR